MVINGDTFKSWPQWFLRTIFAVMAAVLTLSMTVAAVRSQRWVEMVSQSLGQIPLHARSIEELKTATESLQVRFAKTDQTLTRMRADQLSKFMWDAMSRNPPDRAKAAEWESQLRQLLLEQSSGKLEP